ncbi:hypothetical protein MTO96_001036 [Rhipicephalus appendiculatus]
MNSRARSVCSPRLVTVSQAGHQSGPVAPQRAHAQKTFQSGAPRGPDSGRRVTAADEDRAPTGGGKADFRGLRRRHRPPVWRHRAAWRPGGKLRKSRPHQEAENEGIRPRR